MELPNDIFSEIAGVAVSEPVYELAHERRKHPRVGFGGRARIAPLFDTMSARGVTVMLRDVSPAGVGFLSPQRLETSDEFVICLRSKSEKLIKIHCIVRRCDPGGVGLTQFDIGATFEQVLETNAAPEDTCGAGDMGASPAAAKEVGAISIAPRSGGPIKRLLIRPVVGLFSGVGSSIKTYRDNLRVRRRLKADRRKKTPTEESAAPAVAAIQTPAAINNTTTEPLSAPLPIRPFAPRVGGLFQVDSSKTPAPAVPVQSPVAPVAEVPAMPTIEVAAPVVPVVVAPIVEAPVVQAPVIPATPPIETPPIETPAIVVSIPEPVIQEVSATSIENPPTPKVAEAQLEIPWATIEHVVQSPPIAPVIPVVEPPRVPFAETEVVPPAMTPAVEPIQTDEELVVVKPTEATPVHRTQSDVVSLLQKRRAALARHPRRLPQY